MVKLRNIVISTNFSTFMDYLSIVSYSPPKWADSLQNIPKKKVKLAMLPTPVHEWKIPFVPEGFKLSIKRDDMTGCGLSGNKVRKLEFLLADALTQGCKSVITCGSIQSNHCRATAVAARELGLDCHLLLRSNELDASIVDKPGNLLPSVLCNTSLYFIPKSSKYLTDIKPKQDILAKALLTKTGNPAYCIPVGGSNVVGVFGYIQAWQEMVDVQGICESFDDVVVACGSGGSIAGLAIGNYLTGQKVKLHAITVCDNQEYFYEHINEMLHEVGLTYCVAEELVDIVDGYKGAGYGTSSPDDREMYLKIAGTTGVFCDPVYTGKGIKGLLTEMKINPQRFQGKRILFIHTGGMFSLYDGNVHSELKGKFETNSFVWKSTPMYERLF